MMKTYRLAQAAKIMVIDQCNLRKLLRSEKIFNKQNMPYEKYIEAGYFIVNNAKNTKQFRDEGYKKSARKFTEEGINYITKIVKEHKKQRAEESVKQAQARRIENDKDRHKDEVLWKMFNTLWRQNNAPNYCKI